MFPSATGNRCPDGGIAYSISVSIDRSTSIESLYEPIENPPKGLSSGVVTQWQWK